MKKISAILLALLLAVGTTVSAFAAEENGTEPADRSSARLQRLVPRRQCSSAGKKAFTEELIKHGVHKMTYGKQFVVSARFTKE